MSINEDEMMLLDDEDLAQDTPVSDSETEPKVEEQKPEVDQPKVEEPQKEPEYEDGKVLEYLNGKGLIKFNGENVAIKDLDDLVTNYQKGLNYDKHTADDQFILDYIKGNASKLGVNGREYITRVQNYQKEKEKEAQEQDVQRYINSGLSEEVARDIVQTKLAKQEFEKEKAEYQKKIEEAEKKQKEEEEYVEFFKTYPNLKAEEIPQEVFELSREIGIKAAYNQYLVKILKEENERLKQAQENATSSPVGLTSDGSTTNQMSKDPFWEGFDSD